MKTSVPLSKKNCINTSLLTKVKNKKIVKINQKFSDIRMCVFPHCIMY